MSLRLSEIAARLGLEHRGEDAMIERPALEHDAGPGCLCLAVTTTYARQAKRLGCAAVICPPDIETELPSVRSKQPRVAFARILGLFDQRPVAPAGIHPSAVVSASAQVDPTASIGPLAVVEDGAFVGPRTRIGAGAYLGQGTRVGADCDVSARAVVHYGCTVGDRVRLFSGSVIGAEGYGYEWDGTEHVRIPHIGTVVLEDDVEIGANSCVDRAKTGETRIGRGTKIDNLVQIGHGVTVGPLGLMAAQVGIAGSATLGKSVVMAGQTGVVQGATVGDGVIVAAQSGVMSSVPEGKVVMGTPAREATETRRMWAAEARLPAMLARLRALERRAGEE